MRDCIRIVISQGRQDFQNLGGAIFMNMKANLVIHVVVAKRGNLSSLMG